MISVGNALLKRRNGGLVGCYIKMLRYANVSEKKDFLREKNLVSNQLLATKLMDGMTIGLR